LKLFFIISFLLFGSFHTFEIQTEPEIRNEFLSLKNNNIAISAHTPSSISGSPDEVHAWISEISSFGEPVLDNISAKDEIGILRVPYYSSSLTFNIDTMPENIYGSFQYSFRLIGQEKEFSAWSFSNTRTYYQMEPGQFTLLARVKNSVGDVTQLNALRIKVAPPWYRSRIAGILYFLGGIGIFTLVFKIRHKRIAKRRQQFKNEIKIRTEMLKEQANELRQQKERFERTNEIKTRLLRFAAHDLRNPITAIMGYSRILQAEDDPELRKEYTELIHDISGKMYKIVQNMLASGLRDEESFDLDLEDVDVTTILERIYKQYQIFLKQKNQTLNIKVEKDLPSVLADETRISEVLENILSNAIKFSPDGSEIEIKAIQRADLKTRQVKVHITISDKGPGFSEDDQKLAFNEYQTLSAKPTSNESSTGLGLFIVKQLVAAHDGRIIIKNNAPDAGSTIGIVLPAAFVNTAEPVAVTA
jgi:signal transduction histidine kinase